MSLALGTSFARLHAGSASVKRMFRGSAGVWNADAADWIKRVKANSGSVSTATANAVTTFCNAIDAAGIRDKFYRLNLFCGTGLNACLVPLYRGPSLSGTQGGREVDSNHGPFVEGDFVESAGLTGNGSTKHLRIGTLNSVYQGVPGTGHMAAWVGANSDANKRTMGVFDLVAEAGQPYAMGYNINRTFGDQPFGRPGILFPTPSQSGVFQLLNRTSTTNVAYYENGNLIDTAATESINRDIPDADISVFGASYYNWSDGTFAHGYEPPSNTCSSYSCGLSLTGTQVTAYYDALVAFRTAMGRT